MRGRAWAWRVRALVVLVLLIGAPAAAQVGSGQITGVIQDASGANAPNVSVTATHVERNLSRTVLTSATKR